MITFLRATFTMLGNNYIDEMSSNGYGSPRGVPVRRGGGPQKGPKSIFVINGRPAPIIFFVTVGRKVLATFLS